MKNKLYLVVTCMGVATMVSAALPFVPDGWPVVSLLVVGSVLYLWGAYRYLPPVRK